MSLHVEAVPASKTNKDQEIETHAALLRDEVLNIVPGTVNVTLGRGMSQESGHEGG